MNLSIRRSPLAQFSITAASSVLASKLLRPQTLLETIVLATAAGLGVVLSQQFSLSYHMDNPGLDAAQIEVDDVLAPNDSPSYEATAARRCTEDSPATTNLTRDARYRYATEVCFSPESRNRDRLPVTNGSPRPVVFSDIACPGTDETVVF